MFEDAATLIPAFAHLRPRGAIIALRADRRELHDGGTTPDIVPWTLRSGRRIYARGFA